VNQEEHYICIIAPAEIKA
jgi:hypothetical protein